jgi:prepilin-type processing-associated H-X9-DG protein
MLTIIEDKNNNMFDISNFDKIYHSDKINFLYVDENKNFN